MLTVRNLPPAPTVADWVQDNSRLIMGLILWSAALLWLAGAAPRVDHDAWYHVNFAEGGLFYDRMPNEAICKASISAAEDSAACVSGAELGANNADQ